MKNANLQKLIDDGEMCLNETIAHMNNAKCGTEEREIEAKIYKIQNEQLLAAIKLEHEINENDRKFNHEVGKANDEYHNQLQQFRNEMIIATSQLIVGAVMQGIGILNYNARFRDGLIFETDGTVASQTVRGHNQRVFDFMKTKK